MTTLKFTSNYNTQQRAHVSRRLAGLLTALRDGAFGSNSPHGALIRSARNHGLLIGSGPEYSMTERGADWLAVYTASGGDIAPLEDVKAPRPVSGGKKKRAKRQTPRDTRVSLSREKTARAVLVEMILSEPRQWLHVRVDAVDVLTPDALWLWLWFQKNGDRYGTEAAAIAAVSEIVGWDGAKTRAALGLIESAGFAVRIGGNEE